MNCFIKIGNSFNDKNLLNLIGYLNFNYINIFLKTKEIPTNYVLNNYNIKINIYPKKKDLQIYKIKDKYIINYNNKIIYETYKLKDIPLYVDKCLYKNR